MDATSDEAKGDGRIIQVVTFDLGEQEFGIEISAVREIIRMVPTTKIPGAPAFLEGVFELRGHVIPVIDLHNRLGLAQSASKKESCILVIDISGNTFGLLIDGVREVLHLSDAILEQPPAITMGTNTGYVLSIAKLENRLLYLLDAEKLIIYNKEQTELSIY